jgi:homoserine kinase type II
MAVFTEVSAAQLNDWVVREFDLGTVVSICPIASGIENTNYFVDMLMGSPHRAVFTIFERLTVEQVPYYLELMSHFARSGLSVPRPHLTKQGQLFSIWNGKPAAMVSFLAGNPVEKPNLAHCEKLGMLLSKMHFFGRSFPTQQPNQRGFDWVMQTAPTVRSFLPPETAQLLDDELERQLKMRKSAFFQDLPMGAVHCDLFRDNVLFDDQNNPSAIDFYFAGHDTLLFDLCVVINDWCWSNSGVIDTARLQVLCNSYQSLRRVTAVERACFKDMLRAAALRFWVSRLFDFYVPRPSSLLTPKDPVHFERILRWHLANPLSLS